MKFVSKFLMLFVTLTLLAPALAKSDKHCHEEVVKYVQATASPNGNGSKKHPFSTLAAAALATWDVLIVLPSTMTLGGGYNSQERTKNHRSLRSNRYFCIPNTTDHYKLFFGN